MKFGSRFLPALLMLALGLSGCGKPPAPPPATVAPATNSVAANPELQKLRGQWQRPDGGYILEVRSVAGDGVVDAGYFNPSPIRVHGARAYSEGGITKLFVELRDVNYPGCTYQLSYDPKSDQLFGQYYQAAQQQTYDVTFGRPQ